MFGPHPRSYRQRMPRKMRRLALRGAFSSKASEDRLIVVNDLKTSKPNTKGMLQMLSALGITSSALVVTPEPREGLIKSVRNLRRIKSMAAPYLNVLDLLTYDLLVIELSALRKAEEIWDPVSARPGSDEKGKHDTGLEKAGSKVSLRKKPVVPKLRPKVAGCNHLLSIVCKRV